MSDFYYTKDIQVEAYRDSPLIEGQVEDRLTSLRLFRIAARTWPYIRPELKHLIAIGAIFILMAPIGLAIGGTLYDLFYNNLINGDPLNKRTAWLLSLQGPEFTDVEHLSDEARRMVRVGMFKFGATVGLLLSPVLMGTIFYYLWVRQRINQNLRVKMMNQVQTLSLRFHATTQIGDAIYRVYQDSAMVTNIIQLIIDSLRDLYGFGIAFAVLFFLSPQLAGLLLVMTVSLTLLCGIMSSPMRIGFRNARETNSRLTSRIQMSVAGVKVVKANGAEQAEFERFQDEQRRAFSAAYDARSRWSRFGIYAFTVFGSGLLVGEGYMALLSAAGVPTYSTATVLTVTVGYTLWNLGAFRFAVGRLGDSAIQPLALRWGRFQEMTVGLDRAFEILDLEPEVTDAPDAVDVPAGGHDVTFQHVNFSYDPGKPTLRDVSFSAKPGTVTAIVGPTGSGKSTIMSLLLRLFDPSSGRIRLGDTDIRDFRVDSLRGHIAIALQENILFSTSIKENIRYAAPSASDEEVFAAARVADAEEFILALPAGYDTPLGERGAKLSTGQRQRLSIARAVLKNTPVLILDEPTSALDAGTESRVMRALGEWGRDRVIFLITHRISTIRQADQIIYLRGGTIMEHGTHDELVQDPGGAYRRFVDLEESLMNQKNHD